MAAPDAPVLNTPADEATGAPVDQILAWLEVSGALTYGVQVATEDTFAAPLVDEDEIAGLSFQCTALANLTEFFWRVNATNGDGTGDWSAVRSFTTIIALPAVPALSAPADDASGQALDLTLEWAAADRAATYDLQVATDSGFSSLVVDEDLLAVLEFDPAGLLNLTEYFWRVRSVNAAGVSAWATVFSFTTIIAVPAVPVLSAPADLAVNAAVNVALSWAAAARAASYSVQVATEDTFAALVVDESGVLTLSFSNSGLDNYEGYFWRVKAVNAGGESAWSTARAFQTIVGAPSLTLPTDGELSAPEPVVFGWSEPDGATGYRLQVATDAGFSAVVHDDAALVLPAASLPGLDHDTEYFWRVRANSAEGWGAWSAVSDFVTVVETPVAMLPANNASWVSNPVEFSWGSVPGALTYQIQVATDEAFTSIVWDDATLTDPEYEATNFVASIRYFWRVRATDGDGPSPWSPVFAFTSKPAAQTQNRSFTMSFTPGTTAAGDLDVRAAAVTGTSQRLALNKTRSDAAIFVANKSATEIIYMNLGGGSVVATADSLPVMPLTSFSMRIPPNADTVALIGSGAADLTYCVGFDPD